jgi:hypothetical protein
MALPILPFLYMTAGSVALDHYGHKLFETLGWETDQRQEKKFLDTKSASDDLLAAYEARRKADPGFSGFRDEDEAIRSLYEMRKSRREETDTIPTFYGMSPISVASDVLVGGAAAGGKMGLKALWQAAPRIIGREAMESIASQAGAETASRLAGKVTDNKLAQVASTLLGGMAAPHLAYSARNVTRKARPTELDATTLEELKRVLSGGDVVAKGSEPTAIPGLVRPVRDASLDVGEGEIPPLENILRRREAPPASPASPPPLASRPSVWGRGGDPASARWRNRGRVDLGNLREILPVAPVVRSAEIPAPPPGKVEDLLSLPPSRVEQLLALPPGTIAEQKAIPLPRGRKGEGYGNAIPLPEWMDYDIPVEEGNYALHNAAKEVLANPDWKQGAKGIPRWRKESLSEGDLIQIVDEASSLIQKRHRNVPPEIIHEAVIRSLGGELDGQAASILDSAVRDRWQLGGVKKPLTEQVPSGTLFNGHKVESPILRNFLKRNPDTTTRLRDKIDVLESIMPSLEEQVRDNYRMVGMKVKPLVGEMPTEKLPDVWSGRIPKNLREARATLAHRLREGGNREGFDTVTQLSPKEFNQLLHEANSQLIYPLTGKDRLRHIREGMESTLGEAREKKRFLSMERSASLEQGGAIPSVEHLSGRRLGYNEPWEVPHSTIADEFRRTIDPGADKADLDLMSLLKSEHQLDLQADKAMAKANPPDPVADPAGFTRNLLQRLESPIENDPVGRQSLADFVAAVRETIPPDRLKIRGKDGKEVWAHPSYSIFGANLKNRTFKTLSKKDRRSVLDLLRYWRATDNYAKTLTGGYPPEIIRRAVAPDDYWRMVDKARGDIRRFDFAKKGSWKENAQTGTTEFVPSGRMRRYGAVVNDPSTGADFEIRPELGTLPEATLLESNSPYLGPVPLPLESLPDDKRILAEGAITRLQSKHNRQALEALEESKQIDWDQFDLDVLPESFGGNRLADSDLDSAAKRIAKMFGMSADETSGFVSDPLGVDLASSFEGFWKGFKKGAGSLLDVIPSAFRDSLPKPVRDIIDHGHSFRGSYLDRMDRALADLEKNLYRGVAKGDREKVANELLDYLSKNTDVPAKYKGTPVADALVRTKEIMIDLGEQMKRRGMIPETADTAAHLRRSYLAHNAKANWSKEHSAFTRGNYMDDPQAMAAAHEMAANYIARATKRGKKLTEEAALNHAVSELYRIANVRPPESISHRTLTAGQTTGASETLDDVTPAVREFLGEISNPINRAWLGVREMVEDITTHDNLEAISKLGGDILSDGPKKGFVLLEAPKTDGGRVTPRSAAMLQKRWGPLANKWVREDVAKELSRDAEHVSDLSKAWRIGLSIWKGNKVIYSPSTLMRNIIGNSILTRLGGMNLGDQAEAMPSALKELRAGFRGKGNDVFKAAERLGLFSGGYMKNDLDVLYKGYDAVLARGEGPLVTSMLMARRYLSDNPVGESLGNFFSASENLYKYMLFRDVLLRGRPTSWINPKVKRFSPEEAVKYAELYIGNYDNLPKAIKTLRSSVLPFASFPYIAGRAMLKTLSEHPENLFSTLSLGYMLKEVAKEAGFDLSLSDVFPFWDTVSGDADGDKLSDLKQIVTPSGPITLPLELATGKTMGRLVEDVTGIDMPFSMKIDDKVTHAARTLMPNIAPGNWQSMKAMRGVQEGRPEYILDAATGVDLESLGDPRRVRRAQAKIAREQEKMVQALGRAKTEKQKEKIRKKYQKRVAEMML